MDNNTVLSHLLGLVSKANDEQDTVESKPLFQSISSQGFWAKYTDDISDFKHQLYGKQPLTNANCPNCKKPVLHMMSIDTADPRSGLQDSHLKFLPLLFCFTCQISREQFYYQINPITYQVTFLQYGKGGFGEEWPYAPYPLFFPEENLQLIELSEKEQWFNRAINAFWDNHDPDNDESYDTYQEFVNAHSELDIGSHQICGEPMLVQPWETWANRCPVCKNDMSFVASLLDHNSDSRGFTGTEETQTVFTFCKNCSVVGASAQR